MNAVTSAIRILAVDENPLLHQRILVSSRFGVLLIPGLWTPIAGALIALLEIWQIATIAGDR
jgi:hypothetical protein